MLRSYWANLFRAFLTVEWPVYRQYGRYILGGGSLCWDFGYGMQRWVAFGLGMLQLLSQSSSETFILCKIPFPPDMANTSLQVVHFVRAPRCPNYGLFHVGGGSTTWRRCSERCSRHCPVLLLHIVALVHGVWVMHMAPLNVLSLAQWSLYFSRCLYH